MCSIEEKSLIDELFSSLELWRYFIALIISLLGSSIPIAITYLWKLRKLIARNYRNLQKAEKKLVKDIRKSKTLRVYTMKGAMFTEESNIMENTINNSNLEQQYLISSSDNPFIARMNRELNIDHFQMAVFDSIQKFKRAQGINNKIKVRLHKEMNRISLIILDSCLYLSEQKENIIAKKTEVIRIPSGTPEYINYLTYFDDLWDKYVIDSE